MKTYDVAFQDNLIEIGTFISEQNFELAFKTAGTLVHLCNLLEDQDGVFITEMLEGAFNQVGPVVENTQIPDIEIKTVVEKLSQDYSDFLAAYNAKNRMDIFDALSKLRFTATQFQLKWTKIGKPKPTKKIQQLPPMPPQIEAMMKNMLATR
ncbi:MAG: hypothetical protein WCE46_04770 [Methanoregula sp.]|uniref:hypothetical protein n=1 Tax=Methanoregula sp. TaxID=2052170 RepID=UPI003C75FF06